MHKEFSQYTKTLPDLFEERGAKERPFIFSVPQETLDYLRKSDPSAKDDIFYIRGIWSKCVVPSAISFDETKFDKGPLIGKPKAKRNKRNKR